MTWSSVTIMFTRCFPSARHWAKYWDASLGREPGGVWCCHQLTSEEAKWSTAWCPDVVRGGPSAWVRACRAPGKAGGPVPGTRRAPWRQLRHPGGSAPRGICSFLSEEGDVRGTWPLLFQNPQGAGGRFSLISLNRTGARRSWGTQPSSHSILPSASLAFSLAPAGPSPQLGGRLPFLPGPGQLLQSLLRVHSL